MHIGLDAIGPSFMLDARPGARVTRHRPELAKIALTNDLVNLVDWERNQSHYACCDIGQQLYFDRTLCFARA